MITISLCMIVKDEEETLPTCLDSIKELVDEIIIVDTGSKDQTKNIAFKYTDKVYDFEWIEDFSAARNYAFSKASKEYCMWLDADDILYDKQGFKKLKDNINNADIVMMKYNVAFDEENNPTLSYYRERIIKNNSNYKWQGAIHEVIVPNGNIIYSDVAISHHKIKQNDSNRNLRIFEKMIEKGHLFSSREKFYYARELMYHNKFNEAIKEFEEFLDMNDGWVENKIEACKNLSWCYLELNDKDKAFNSLIKSLTISYPRAEICCDLGELFLKQKQYENAKFWYHAALNCKKEDKNGGFILNDCYDFIPYMQLCVCYYNLNNLEESQKYNELAGSIKPKSSSYLFNKSFFDNKRSK